MRSTTARVALVSLILGVALGAAGHAVFFGDDNHDAKAGIYCYHPNALNPFKTTCIRRSVNR
jgi:hypothetical protein